MLIYAQQARNSYAIYFDRTKVHVYLWPSMCIVVSLIECIFYIFYTIPCHKCGTVNFKNISNLAGE